ncbi:F0F1 ATP synthase subunit B [Mesorhizobium xinjiangense]|uniref:F0F1 ATP synthase subunit B n=1 Tax=Mesorhizobium xinjiangense TaxID=2678685 RepID=UPI0012EECAD8|nr:F0F1 ATP synthase subunit B [Mesorhizobium xinjiangense]
MFVTYAFAQESNHADGESAAEGVTHTETGVPHEGGHEATFPPFDPATYPSQILWLAVTFGLFYLFMKRVALPRISGTLEIRRDRVAQDLDQAARMKEEADEAIAAYEQELAQARNKAGGIGQEARDAAKAEADAERAEVEGKLDEQLAKSEARIGAIKAEAMKDVGTIAEDTAAAIVEQLVGKATKADIAAAVKSVSQ